MPVKDRRTKILLLLILNGGFDFAFVSISETLQEIYDLSLNQKTRGTLSALIREGAIEKNKEESADNSQYRLTPIGLKKLCLEFPFFRFMKDDWDGLWRIISYEIPESKREIRDRLRREMRGWGLGPWHRSFWITPHPIVENLRELVYGREEQKYVQSFEATHVFGDIEVLLDKVWNVSMIDKKYREVFKKWYALLSQDQSAVDKMKQITYDYIELLRQDPGLPRSIIGAKWIGFEAYDIFSEVRAILMK